MVVVVVGSVIRMTNKFDDEAALGFCYILSVFKLQLDEEEFFWVYYKAHDGPKPLCMEVWVVWKYSQNFDIYLRYTLYHWVLTAALY